MEEYDKARMEGYGKDLESLDVQLKQFIKQLQDIAQKQQQLSTQRDIAEENVHRISGTMAYINGKIKTLNEKPVDAIQAEE